MAIDWTAVQKKAKRQDAAYNAKATQGADNRTVYQAIANNKAATAAQIKANPSAATASITPITMAQTAAGVANGSIPNAFQNQKESGADRAIDTVGASAANLVGGLANATKMATTGKYSPVTWISKGIDKINGTNYTAQNAANQQSFVDKMMDQSKLSTEYAKRGISKAGQTAVDIGSGATELAGNLALGALTGGSALAPMATQAFGSGAYSAQKAGAPEEKQLAYGALEGGTVALTQGLMNAGSSILTKAFGKSPLSRELMDKTGSAIAKFVKSDAGRAVANKIASTGESALSQSAIGAVQAVLEPAYQKITFNPDAKENAEDIIHNAIVSGAIGALVGAAGKNNLKALETENDAKAAERRAAAKNAPDLSQVAPNLVRPTQNIAQEAAQAPTVNESVKEVKLPVETENALKTQQGAPEAKANIFPENSAGAKTTTDAAQQVNTEAQGIKVYRGYNRSDSATERNLAKQQTVFDVIGKPQKDVDTVPLSYYTESAEDAKSYADMDVNLYERYKEPAKADYFYAVVDGKIDPKSVDKEQWITNRTNEYYKNLTGKDAPTAGHVQEHTIYPKNILDLTELGDKTTVEDIYSYLSKKTGIPETVLDDQLMLVDISGDPYEPINTFSVLRNVGNTPSGQFGTRFVDFMKEHGFDAVHYSESGASHYAVLNEPSTVQTPASEAKTSIFPENSIGAKITNDMPQGTGAKSLEFPYKERVNQQNSTQTAFTPKEQAIDGLRPEDSTHQVITDKNAMAKAQERIDFDFEGEKADLPNKQDWDKNDTTTAQLILRKLTGEAQKSGDYSDVIKWNKTLTQHTSAQGQALQANAQFANTPERIVADAAETLFGENTRKLSDEDKNNIMKTISDSADKLDNIKQGDTASVIELIKSLNVVRKTTGLFSKETSAQMSGWLDYASKLPDGEAFLRDVAAQQIRNVASDYQKTSVLNAIKNYRVMGMLSKATTILRNLTANNIFDPIESLSTNAGVPLDILLSKYTKTRSTSVDKSWFSSAKRKGSIDGFVKSAIQVGLDADVTNSSSKYETHSVRTFKMTGNPVERFLSTWAKWENYGLQSTDEFQKGGIAAETQRGIDQLKSKGLVAKDALTGRAEEVAKQRTFQNDGALATAMLKGRDALNVFSVKDKLGGSLGAGDVAVPFAKVPANIVAQGGNYSPAGFIKAIGNLGKTLAQAHEGTLTADQQAKAVTDFGRATTGSAGIAMFTALALKGIIKVAGSDDKDKEALQTSEGQNGTQFNISALNRWINGKSADWQDGDTLMSIGFLEPINAQMAMGAMIADAYKDDGKAGLADVANANVSSIFQSVLDLPAMSQISDLVNGYKNSSADKTSGKLGDAALGYGASQAASFLIPNIVGGVATGMDGTVRNTYTSKNPLKRASDNIVSKIPGLRNTLPAKQDIYGNDRHTTGNKLLDTLNANILPGQIGKYSTNEVNQELYRLDTKYPVRNAPNTIKSNKLTYALTLDEKAKYLKTMGQTENSLMQAMISSSAYKSMTDAQKSDALKNLMAYASDKANREFVTSKGAKYTSEKYEKVYEAEQQGVSPTGYFTYKTKLDEINDDGTVTELEAARALEKTDLSQSEKGKLWQNQNVKFSPEKNPYSGTLAQLGLAPSKTIEIMEAFGTIDDAIGKNYVKADKGPSAAQVKAAYLIQWLTRQGYNANQRAAITDVFTTWQMIAVDKISKKATAFVSANPMP